MAEIVLENVSKKFGDVQVLHDINLCIAEGEFIVFVGPSGCGKSTLLRLIAGLEKITSGTLTIGGALMNKVPPALRGVAMVFQNYALYPHMTVFDNMAFALKLGKDTKAQIKEKIDRTAELLGLSNYLDRLPKELSGGQRQRVAIGRTIVRDPKIFLFDEPLSNLDAKLRVAMRLEIANLNERLGDATMIYVTHDQVEAMTLADRIVVLSSDGGIEQVGIPLDLYLRPANLFVAGFIGSPAMNIIDATVIQSGNETKIRANGTAHEFMVSVHSRSQDIDAPVKFGVRPEDLTVTDGEFLIEGTVSYVEELGDTSLVYLEVGNSSDGVVVKIAGIVEYAKGEVLKLNASKNKLHLFDSNGVNFLKKTNNFHTDQSIEHTDDLDQLAAIQTC